MTGIPVTAEHLNRYRAVVQWVLRAAAAAMIILGAYLVLKRIGFAIGTGTPSTVFRNWTEDLGEGNSFYRGLALIVVGVLVGVLAGRVSRWIIAVPRQGCPRCGHARAPGSVSECPECGMSWSASD